MPCALISEREAAGPAPAGCDVLIPRVEVVVVVDVSVLVAASAGQLASLSDVGPSQRPLPNGERLRG